MKSVLAITDETVLATSIVNKVLNELGNEYVGNCDSQIITQAFSLSKLPLGASSVDAIISICRSDFPSDRLCEEISRVLKPGGIILIHKTSQSVAVEKDESSAMVRRLLLAGFLEAQVIEKKLVSPFDVKHYVIRAKKPSWKIGSSFAIKKPAKSLLPKIQLDDDSDLIDEDSLLTEEDLKKPQLPPGEELSDLEVENGAKHCGFEDEPETIAIMDAVKVLLQGLGEDINREGIKKTPLRVAKALREGTRGYGQTANDIIESALFPEDGLHNGVGQAGGAGGIVIVRDLDFFSYCESCLLPFQVKCHVGYVPSGQRVVGLSKLSRVADVFAKRLQKPQRLADQICLALHHGIKPGGVAVVLHCMHAHFPSLEPFFLDLKFPGWVKLQVQSGSGAFESQDADVWMDFFSLLKFRGTYLSQAGAPDSNAQLWCPSRFSSASKLSTKPESLSLRMTTAVTSILRSLGEDPSRKELLGTPGHFVNWLMNFKNCNVEMKIDMKKFNGIANGRTHFEHNENGNLSEKQIQSATNFLFWSQCEHHLLPFYGVVHIGFLREDGLSPLEKSLLNSVIHFYGFKLQVQERMTRQIAETVSSLLGTDVVVVVEGSHTCMISRGVEKFGSTTATIAALGQFSSDAAVRSLFLQSIPQTTIGEL